MAFWAAAAPALISAGASILGGLMSKKRPTVHPLVAARERKLQGFVNELAGLQNRGRLLDDKGNVLTLRLGKGWGDSLNQFMNAADFDAKRRAETLLPLISALGGNQGSLQQGQAMDYQAGMGTAGILGKAINSIGQAAWNEYGVGGGGEDSFANVLSKSLVDKIKVDDGDPGVLDLTTLKDKVG